MPLVLSLQLQHKFYIGDKTAKVVEIVSPMEFTVNVDGKLFDIDDVQAKEVLPDVFMSAGDRPQFGFVRALIDAPRSIHISRGDREASGAGP
jgi:hypothetical protein